MKEMVKGLISWAVQISNLYNEIERITEFSFRREGSTGYYGARVVIDKHEFKIERTVESIPEDFKPVLPPEFSPGMMKEILHEWAKHNNVDLSPDKPIPETIYSKGKELRCVWDEVK